jgi:hypothetical protein
MKRRRVLLVAVTAAVLGLAVLGSAKKDHLLLLDWAAKAPAESPPVAVLIELGVKDEKPASWAGGAAVTGARVVRREGYRFRDDDKLVEPDAWEVSTHRVGQRPANPAPAARNLPFRPAWVGIVLHLADVTPDAALTLRAKGKDREPVTVAVRDLLAGQPKQIWDGAATVRRVSTAGPVVTAPTEDDFPAAAFGPDGTLWLAYVSYTLKEEERRAGRMQIPKQPDNFQAYDTPEFGDQLFVKYRRDGKWGEPVAVTDARQDLVRCAVAVDGGGTPWVAYSANREGQYHLYARPLRTAEGAVRPGEEQQLTRRPTPDLTPVMCTDLGGRVWLACQSWGEDGRARVRLFTCQDGKWSDGPALPEHPGGNCWSAALAAGPGGQVAVAYDVYQDGDYDVHVAVIEGGKVTPYPVATSPRFEARPSLAYDARGRLWVAFEDGPERWGKDFGALDRRGSPLYNTRSVRVVCLDGGKLLKPSAELVQPRGGPFQINQRTAHWGYPELGLDDQGRLWLSYRQRIATPFGVQPGTSWITVARRLDGDRWTAAVDLHHSDGLLDSRPVLLPHAGGGLLVVHNTDGRYATPLTLDNQVYASVLDLPGEPAEPRLVPCEAGTKDGKEAEADRAAVRRIRDYRVEVAGKTLRPLRGEFHRHCEVSFDGGNDGSLEDLFRYAVDCAALDWVGDGDHDNGNGREYTWWLVQKLTDAYFVRDHFTPMFCYERSVQYPMGHRNCMFARRGVRTLPRLAEPDMSKRVGGVHADDTKMLYRYLHELGGICASHTSATGMGTDWRDNDPEVEPFVEIYQGDRNSYEYEDAPRSGHDPKGNKLPASIGGWQPAGFIVNALKTRGYRLGFQSSSDHVSTHISYAVALAERHDRAAILDAFRKRHCYGATDNIILEVRSGTHLMGDEFKTASAPALEIAVVGTGPLDRVEVLKDSEVVETFRPGKPEYKGSWTDPKPSPGVHYYYVRVQQADEALAWASPLWIDYKE